MKFKLLVLSFLLSVTVGWGQSIFTNPLTFAATVPSSPYTAGQTVDPNITVSGISRSSGITGVSAGNRYTANGWSTGAIDLNDYFEFTLTPNAGYEIDFVSFVYTGQVSSGTPSHAFRSSLDAYASNIGAPSTTGTTISLSGAVYQNIITPITFRFYSFGLAAGTTTFSINDFTFNGTVTPTAASPEINLQGNAANIASGDITPALADHTDFGTVGTASGTIVRTFTIQNTGTASLSLTGASPYVTIAGANAADFSVTAIPSNSIAVLGSTTFQVTFDPSADGLRQASVSIANNDSNENPYTFSIQGTGVSTPVITSALTASGNQGIPFTYTIVATNTPTSYNAVVLPAGLTIDTVTGIISGTPSVTGTFNVTISATNVAGTDNETLVITLGAGPCLTATFESGAPAGWTMTGMTYGGQFCEGSSGMVFNAVNDAAVTPAIANPQTLTFQKKRSGGTDAWSLKVQVSSTGAAPWTDVQTITAISGTCALETVDLSAYTSGTYYIRFIDTRPSGIQERTIDDVKVFCGTPTVPEMNVTGNSVSIADGDVTPNMADDTDFGSTLVGNIITKTFTIQNTGVDPLILTGTNPYITIAGAHAADFSVSVVPATPIAALTGTTTFEITFQPSALGLRTATLSIANNDGDENPYNFSVQGNGITCTPTTTISSITPASGPVGTLVTINGAGFTTASTVRFGALNAVFTVVSNTLITATVPANATTGDVTIQDIGACDQSYSLFTVITDDKTTCAPSAVGISELFISEVTDASSGSLSYIEVFNATAATIDMTDYAIEIVNNGTSSVVIPLTGTLASGDSFTLATSVGSGCAVPGGDASLADQTQVHSGINNNDCIHLSKLGVNIDTWGECDGSTWINALGLGSAGYDFRRKETATPLPTTTFNAADWNIVDFNACSDDYSAIDSYAGIRNPPLTTSPSVTLNCRTNSAQITVTGTEAVLGGASLTFQWFVAAPGNIGWTSLTNAGIYSGVTTNVLSISNLSGLNGYQYYCQVMEDTSTCYVASNATVLVLGSASSTWNGTAWDNGVPSITTAAVINGNYNTAIHGDFSCCSLVVNATYTLDIRAVDYVEIQYDLTVNGTLNVWDDGSLIQVDDSGVNTGNINYERITTGVNLDYVYWSSPVNGVNTPATGYIYSWDPDFANPNGGWGYWLLARNTPMAPGVGYIMRNVFNRTFTGVPRNGVVQPTIGRANYTGADFAGNNGVNITNKDDNWNLIGNPYPSAINALDFLNLNANIEGSVRVWTHGTSPSTSIQNPIYNSYVYNYTVDDYIVYNGTGTVSGPSGFNGFIAGGQSFMVNMNDGAAATGTVTFNNSLRNINHNNEQFYRQSLRNTNGTDEKHRIWLDLANANNNSTRTLIGYVSNATYEKDRLYDAVTNALGNGMAIFSTINNERMAIQGRTLPFDNQDKVPLGIKVPTSGTYSIGLSALDGLFATDQKIYLEDRQLNVIHDLKANPYFFTLSVPGFVHDRFVLRYTNTTLSNDDFEATANSVAVYANESINVSSSLERIKDVLVYDVLGRVITEKKNINGNTTELTNVRPTQSPLIVKVTLENGQTITKKVIY